MPEVAPVTSAVWPCRSRVWVVLMLRLGSDLNRLVCLLAVRTIDRPVCYCQGMASTTIDQSSGSERVSARERLLAAADELFYEQGVHTVGIDRVIERAGVAKATLYSAFGSKDALIQAYLERRHEGTRARTIEALATRYTTPREKILGIYDVIGERIALPGFRGCAFVNASAESPEGGTIGQASDESRAWIRGLFRELSAEAGVVDPDGLSRQLMLLYDGTSVAGRMDRDLEAAASARAAAAAVLDAGMARAR
jgi:AcrR family transcriptional regulator